MVTRQRCALVTGASSGIGAALALHLGQAGWQVALVARRERRLRELAERIDGAKGPGVALVLPADLTQREAPDRVVAAAVEHFGGLDLLVNNAGRGAFGLAQEVIDEDFSAQFDLNVWAPVALVRAAVPHLKARGGGQILNLGSVVGYVGLQNASLYAATKWALRGLNETWREELYPHHIKVAYVAPGYTMTEFGPRDPGMAEWALSCDDVVHACMCVIDQGANSDIKELIVQVLDRS